MTIQRSRSPLQHFAFCLQLLISGCLVDKIAKTEGKTGDFHSFIISYLPQVQTGISGR
jgi:hypothetical protein